MWYHHKPFIFVNDLKLIAINLNLPKQQLDLVTQLCTDTEMLFEESKCTFLDIYNFSGTIVGSHEEILMKGVTIKPFKE